ncbi:acyl carrier protein [Piscinibacter gummiphilus]|uniref:Acyl carrier protein n=1 Tax=Piscinibacter gummiphilus TaxID=946333 RepID=A0A1W6LBS3_9BURK|nr:phosphopantetheine-binding protein [Piscinibacter gummiphilus]ARN21709.1 acyl carrier protein [Piscinibacter gummiphilus]ATU66398.1 acyl carrier protein [Piscinibacter gummiphilus]GLS95719.1 acyl carrier protein [Piscinibacter gummiphilus]
MTSDTLVADLKALILDAAEKDNPPGGLTDDEVLFGPEARLGLDSLDALQVSMAIQERYGVRMPDSKDTRRALTSIAHLAEFLRPHLVK